IETVEMAWPEVAGFINDSPEFISNPNVDPEDYGKFLMIVVAGNFNYIPDHFEDGHDREIIKRCIEKFADVFDITTHQFAAKVKDYRCFMSRVNMPSKNTLYGMSKAVFHKYNLNPHQEDYFKSLKTPNPIFLKNLDEMMRYFLWDFEAFNDKFRIIHSEN
ncbi:MAG: hypothetical protein HRT74_06740, partial [Flavobacteriales bacterium]|nr:hypothetical protein [Flavobacteriales bacterium]